MNQPGTRVLIVDDDEDIRANFADILGDLGYEVETANNGQQAIEHVNQQRFDIVLLDYKMPGMDGASLYGKIKKIQPAVAAIMVTAWAGSDGAQQAKDAGTWDVLRKPVDIAELLRKLELAASAPIVLVVDDDEVFCDSLWQILNERHYRVHLAHTEADGVARALDSNCQIAIVDLKLGLGDGCQVIQRIHEAAPTARTVVVSGHPQDASRAVDEFGARLISAVCKKPIDIDHLLEMIELGTKRN